MPLESATYISELDPTNPVGSSDLVSSLDDHMRLVKATLQNTFPNIDGAVNATEDQINLLAATSPNDRVLRISSGAVGWGQLTAGMFPSQVVPDSALSGNVSLKNAPQNVFTGQIISERTIPQYIWRETDQGTDNKTWIVLAENGTWALRAYNDGGTSSNTAIAVGRSGATISSIALTANAITFNGVNINNYARKDVQNTFTDSQIISAASASLLLRETDAAADNQWWAFNANNEQLRGVVYNDVFAANNWLVVDRTGNTVDAIAFSAADIRLSGAVLAATIATSTSTTLVAGQVHAVASNAALPNMTAGQWVGVINNSASPITVTKHASDTMYWTASGASVTSVTVAARGKATFICADGANVYASGNIIGSS